MIRAQGSIIGIVRLASDQPFAMLGGERFRPSNEHLADLKRIIKVLGGVRSMAIGCKPRDPRGLKSYEHGFSGKRREVVSAINDSVTGMPVPDRIGP
jgi:hypothetical protein